MHSCSDAGFVAGRSSGNFQNAAMDDALRKMLWQISVFHVDHQFVKNLERLGFVFQKRIALAVGAQAMLCRRLSIS